MAHVAGDSTRANVRSRVGFSEYPQNLATGGAITPPALERFDPGRGHGVRSQKRKQPFCATCPVRPSGACSMLFVATVT
jgi:hypothetical protein